MTVEMRGEGQSVDRRFETGGDVTGRRKQWEVRRVECARADGGSSSRLERGTAMARGWGIGIRSSGEVNRREASRRGRTGCCRRGWDRSLRANQRGEAVSRRSRSTAAEPAAHSAFPAQSEEKEAADCVTQRPGDEGRKPAARKKKKKKKQSSKTVGSRDPIARDQGRREATVDGRNEGLWWVTGAEKTEVEEEKEAAQPRSRRCVGLRLGCWGCWLCRGRW